MDYMLSVLRTENKTLAQPEKILGATLGLAGECGEVVDIIKKVQFHGHDLDINKLKLELGDVFYYLYSLCHLHNLTVEEVLDANVKKLEKRYPNGFSVNDSKRRDGLIDLYNCKVGDTITRRDGIETEVKTVNGNGHNVFINRTGYLRNGSFWKNDGTIDMDIVAHNPLGRRVMMDLRNCKVGDTITRRDGIVIEVENVTTSVVPGYEVFINGTSYLRDGSYWYNRAPCNRDVVKHIPPGRAE